LLKDLIEKAPGTYHHSMMVANLSANAVEAIGGDSLLTRVASYYHDVGKTLHPLFFVENLPAGVELLALMRRMFSMRKDEFITAFDKWCDKWKEFLNERTLLISGKTTYTHRRLRTARRSIKTHLTWLYTCEEHPDIQIPNTTNQLEGFNSQLKRALHNHNGLNGANKKKFIDGFINTKSRLE